jgi:long-subunit fatty acid transport protein
MKLETLQKRLRTIINLYITHVSKLRFFSESRKDDRINFLNTIKNTIDNYKSESDIIGYILSTLWMSERNLQRQLIKSIALSYLSKNEIIKLEDVANHQQGLNRDITYNSIIYDAICEKDLMLIKMPMMMSSSM